VRTDTGTGYIEACLKAGRISRDGQWIIFDDAAHAVLRQHHNPGYRPPQLPSKWRMMLNVSGAIARQAKAILQRHSLRSNPREVLRRKTICEACEWFRHDLSRCAKCGCKTAGLIGKWKLAQEHCPLPTPKW